MRTYVYVEVHVEEEEVHVEEEEGHVEEEEA
jgi:hypothetical protein